MWTILLPTRFMARQPPKCLSQEQRITRKLTVPIQIASRASPLAALCPSGQPAPPRPPHQSIHHAPGKKTSPSNPIVSSPPPDTSPIPSTPQNEPLLERRLRPASRDRGQESNSSRYLLRGSPEKEPTRTPTRVVAGSIDSRNPDSNPSYVMAGSSKDRTPESNHAP